MKLKQIFAYEIKQDSEIGWLCIGIHVAVQVLLKLSTDFDKIHQNLPENEVSQILQGSTNVTESEIIQHKILQLPNL